jgi:hypothetical protein
MAQCMDEVSSLHTETTCVRTYTLNNRRGKPRGTLFVKYQYTQFNTEDLVKQATDVLEKTKGGKKNVERRVFSDGKVTKIARDVGAFVGIKRLYTRGSSKQDTKIAPVVPLRFESLEKHLERRETRSAGDGDETQTQTHSGGDTSRSTGTWNNMAAVLSLGEEALEQGWKHMIQSTFADDHSGRQASSRSNNEDVVDASPRRGSNLLWRAVEPVTSLSSRVSSIRVSDDGRDAVAKPKSRYSDGYGVFTRSAWTVFSRGTATAQTDALQGDALQRNSSRLHNDIGQYV